MEPKRMVTESLCAALLALLAAAPAYPQEKPPPIDEKQIQAAIADLGHEEFDRREEATDRLRKGGKALLPYLREGYRKSKDPEVTVRIRRLAKDLFLKHIYVNQGPPFLGITYTTLMEPPTGAKEGQGGFEVYEVMKGHPAAKAGFLPGDIILSFDGESVKEGETIGYFRNRILSRQVGQVVTIEVIQGGEQKSLRAKLGKRPEEANAVPPKFLHPQRRVLEFERWWKVNFKKSPEPSKDRKAEPEPLEKPLPKPQKKKPPPQ